MHRNKALLVKEIGALIGKYNLLAEERGMKKMPYPSYYGNALNDMSNIFFLRDLKAISNAVKEIKEIPIVDKMKTARGVVFAKNTVPGFPDFKAWTKDEDDLWYYIQNGDDICVYGKTSAIIKRLNGGTTLVLDYADMPYEVLVDNDRNMHQVTSYTFHTGRGDNIYGLFGWRMGMTTEDDTWNANIVSILTSLTIQNWTNRNVTDISWMFHSCDSLTTVKLNNFDTSTVTNMANMFSVCSGLTTLTLGENFNTSKIENTLNLLLRCDSLTTVSLYQNASSIVIELPTATWTVTNNESGKSGTVTVSQGTSATWSGDVPSPWTLTRTIQAS